MSMFKRTLWPVRFPPAGVSWRRLLGGTLVVIAMSLIPAASAAAGLDSTFGTDGWVRTDFGSSDDAARSLALQQDGKLVAAGWVSGSGGYDFALARLNRNGSLDTSFGSGGTVVTDFDSPIDKASAVAVQSDGKIVAAGVSWSASQFDYNVAVSRYNPDGSLDSGFGSGGKVLTDLTYGDVFEDMVIQPDGKIIVAGSSWFGVMHFVAVRYTTDGMLDPGFGSGGIATVDIGDGGAQALALQPDGKIVMAGYSRSDGLDFALARLNTDGSLDSSFGTTGTILTDFGFGPSSARDIGVQADGRIVAVGVSGDPNENFALARYLPDGSLDSGFGSGGKVSTDLGNAEANALVIQPDGGIVATGQPRPVFVRYLANGTLDPAFGSGGVLTPNPYPVLGTWSVVFTDAVIQPDGSVVAAGTAAGNFALARVAIDTEPPSIVQPADETVDATAPNGAYVTFDVEAIDNLDQHASVSCDPQTGSLFGLGTTTVTCTATDASGNQSPPAYFTVHVRDAVEQVADLAGIVDRLALGKLGASLHDKLVAVQRMLEASKPTQACENLDSFLQQVASQSSKALIAEQATELSTKAKQIKTVIGC